MVNIYILKLEDNKFYIGTTNDDVNIMCSHHKNNKDCEWTTKYPPIELSYYIISEYSIDIDKLTKSYMKDYGIENVRGGSYSQIKLDDSVIKSLEHELSSTDINIKEIFSQIKLDDSVIKSLEHELSSTDINIKEILTEIKMKADKCDVLLDIFQQQVNIMNDMKSNFFNKESKKKVNERDNKIKELNERLGMIEIKECAEKLKKYKVPTIGV